MREAAFFSSGRGKRQIYQNGTGWGKARAKMCGAGGGQGKTVGKWDFHKTIFSNSISLTTVVLDINMKQIQGFYSYNTS